METSYGERSQVRDHYEEMIITLLRNNDENLKLQIQVRAYNEGIAFRYFFPENPEGGMDINIQKELTEFYNARRNKGMVYKQGTGCITVCCQ